MINMLLQICTIIGFFVGLTMIIILLALVYEDIITRVRNRTSKNLNRNLYRIIKAMNSIHKLDRRLVGRTYEGEWIDIIDIDIKKRRENE